MIKKLIIIFVLISSVSVSQTALTKDAFFPKRKLFPRNYKSIIIDSRWKCLGSYKIRNNKITVPDSLKTGKIFLFDNGKTYRKIRRKKIVSNTDFATEKIIYVDNTTLILETKDKKNIYRRLYQRVL